MSTWVVAGIILTGAWTQLDEIGWAGWLPLAVTLLLDRRTTSRSMVLPRRPPLRATLPVAGAALLCVLILAHVGLTAREEFGFGGDEGYHLSATRAFALYFMHAGPVLACALAVFALWRWRRWRYAASMAMAALIAGSYFLPRDVLFGRYPTGYYYLATPLAVFFELGGIPFPSTANHIVNALSVPAWLFLLRPIVVGRWPDWQVMPVACFVYLQAPALTYVGSALLEPWAFVFVLLSLEAAVTEDRDRRWLAVPLAATAVAFKETTVLLLPTVWLITGVEWKGWRPAIRPGALALGAACVVPFLVYYAVRRGLAVERTFALAAASDVWTAARASEWFANVRMQAGIGAVLSVAIVIGATMRYWWWTATALLIVMFFFGDAASVPYTGYGRFVAYALLALSGGLFACTYAVASRPAVLIAMTTVIVLLQSIPFARTLALDFEPGYARNSLEWYGSLVRLPLRALIERLPEARDADQVRRVRVVAFGPELVSVPVAYPDLAARYTLVLDPQAADAVDCRCRGNAEAVVAGFEWPAHFGNTDANHALFRHVGGACVEQINTTCGTTILEQHQSGAVIGALGVGRVVLIALPQHDQGAKR